MKILMATVTTIAFFCFTIAANAGTDPDMEKDVRSLQQQWAHIQYRLNGKQARIDALDSLQQTAEQIEGKFPYYAEPKIWHGIILATRAGVERKLSSLKQLKRARSLFEQAVDINERALDGSAHVSLGTLYYQVPGWPIAFGNDRKAMRHLKRALEIAPTGIDAHYFMAGLMEKNGDHLSALTHLEIAQAAPNRPDRPLADTGRHAEIKTAINRVRSAALN